MSLVKISPWLLGIGAATKDRRNRSKKQKQRQRVLVSEQLENRRLMVTDLIHFLTQEHIDLNIQHTAGEWNFGPRDSDATPPIQYANNEAAMYVGAPALTARPSGSAFNFIGVDAGADFYLLPQSQNTDLLYMGFAAYGVTSATVDRYVPTTESKGRVTSNARWVKASVNDVRHTTPSGATGDGVFSVWQTGTFGTPTVYMSSYNDGVSNPDGNGLDVTDGISNDDALWILAGGHAHFNVGFTKPGRYEIDFRLSTYFGDDGLTTPNTGGFSQSIPITLYFSVMSVGQFDVERSSYSVNENAGTVSVDIIRTGGSDGRVSVDYTTADTSALAGRDYTATSGTLEFLDGETRKTIVIPILNDLDEESSETFRLLISNPKPENIDNYVRTVESDSNGILGSIVISNITIVDDDENTPPTISNVGDQSTDEDTPTGEIAFTVDDSRTAPGDLIVTATSDNLTLVSNANIVLGGTGANRWIRINPSAEQSGSATITLTVTDAGGLTAIDTFVLTVQSVNDTPSISEIFNQSTDLNTPTQPIAFAIGDLETDVTLLVVSGFSSDQNLVPNSNITFGGSGANRTVILTPALDLSGFTTITIMVTDQGGRAVSESFVLAVGDVNEAPSISDLLDQIIARDSATAEIPFTIADRESSTQNLILSASSSNTALVINDQILLGGSGANRTVKIFPNANMSGSTMITLTVIDEGGKSATDSFILTVDDPPRISAMDDQIVVQNYSTAPIDFVIRDTETAAENLVLSVSSSNTAIVSVENVVLGGSGLNRTVTITPKPDVIGASEISIHVTDEAGQVTTETFILSVVDGGLGAVADEFSIYGLTELHGSVLLNDQWHESLTTPVVSLEANASHGTLVLLANGAFSYIPGDSFSGEDTFRYRLTQSGGDFTVAEVTLVRAMIPDFEAILLEGHADIGLAIGAHQDGYGSFGEDDEWDLHLHDEESDIEYHADEALIFVGNEARTLREGGAADPAFDFLGVGVGEAFYVLPETENPELLFLGIGSEEIEPGTLLGGSALLKLVSVNGPGYFSIWNSSTTNPIVRMATGDGISSDDVIQVIEGSHAHFNYAFSAPGDYFITLIAEGSLADGTEIHGDNVTFFFRVGNREPIAVGEAIVVHPGNISFGNVLFNDTDPDADTMTVQLLVNATKGTLALNSNGSFAYAPSESFDGTDTFTYVVHDPFGSFSIGIVSITAASPRNFDVNLMRGHTDIGLGIGSHDGPEEEWDLHIHDEESETEYHADEALLFVGNKAAVIREGAAADPAFDFLGVAPGETVYVLSEVENPDLLFLGVGAEEVEPGTLLDGLARLQLISVNGAGHFSIWSAGALQPSLKMSTTDGVGPGDFLTVFEGEHAHYNFSFSEPGFYEVTFQASGVLQDGSELISEYVTYYFRVGNNDPIAVADSYFVDLTHKLQGNVLFNDSDPNGDNFSVELVTDPSKGELVFRSDGSFVYTPSALFSGTDSFTYRITDGFEANAIGTVTIHQAAIRSFEAFLLRGHADIGLEVEENVGTGSVEWDLHLHSEEDDAEYHPYEAQLFVGNDAEVIRQGASAGPLFDFLGVAPGNAFYVLPETENPDLLYLGLSTEEIETGTLQSGIARLQLVGVNGPGEFSIWSSGALQPTVRVATSDGISLADSVTLVEGSHAHFNYAFSKRGNYEIIFKAFGRLADGTEIEGEASSIFFRVGNNSPQSADDSFVVSPDNSLRGNVLFNDSDPDGDSLSAQVLSQPTKGTVTLRADGSFVYVPSGTFAGADSFTYSVHDPYEGLFVGNVSIVEAVGKAFDADLVLGHVDISAEVHSHEEDENHWDFHIHDEESDVEYHPEDAQFILNATSRLLRTGGAAGSLFDFLGVAAGEAFFVLPELENVNQLFLGISADSIDPETFVEGTAKLKLISVDGPGEFSVWTNSLVAPEVHMATLNGITADDYVELIPGSHSHYNYAFSKLGSYALTFQATGILLGGEVVTSNLVTFFFEVANLKPTLTAVEQISLLEDAIQQTVSLADIGPGLGELQNVRITVSSDNVVLIPTPTLNYIAGANSGTLGFRPTPELSGTANIIVRVEDSGFDGNLETTADNSVLTHTIQVLVQPVNDTPTLAALSNRSILEDATLQTVSFAGVSAGGGETQPLRVMATSSNPGLIPNPSVSYTSPLASGTLTFIPAPDQWGTATITVFVEDGGLDGNLNTLSDNAIVSQSFSVTVNAVNDIPTITPIDDVTIDEDALEQTINLSGITAGGGESQPLLVVVTSSNTDFITTPILSYSSPNSTGSIRFTPVQDRFGTSQITITVTDGGLDNDLGTPNGNFSVTRTFMVTVRSVNDRPIALGNNYEIFINTASNLDVLQNDSDVEDGRNSLALEVVTQPAGGTVTVNNGQLRFTPNLTRVGVDSFTYRVRDTQGLQSEIATVDLLLMENPQTAPDTFFTAKNQSFTADVLANDVQLLSPLNISTLTLIGITPPGTAQIENGAVRITPASGYVGTITFSYTVANQLGLVSPATSVTVNVLNRSFTNPQQSFDVNGDFYVTAIDALIIINELNRKGGPRPLNVLTDFAPPYLDVNGDFVLNALDALSVINRLNSRSSGGAAAEGEGEDESGHTLLGYQQPDPLVALIQENRLQTHVDATLLEMLAEDHQRRRRAWVRR